MNLARIHALAARSQVVQCDADRAEPERALAESALPPQVDWQTCASRLVVASTLCGSIRRAGSSASAQITPDDPGPAAIRFTINSGQEVKAISPYIYGSNSSQITNRTFDRSGGNRLTGYNWETNASNAGADWYHHSDYHLTNGQANRPPGSAVSGMIQSAGHGGPGGAGHHPDGRLRQRRRQRHGRRNADCAVLALAGNRAEEVDKVSRLSAVAESQQDGRVRVHRRVRELGREHEATRPAGVLQPRQRAGVVGRGAAGRLAIGRAAQPVLQPGQRHESESRRPHASDDSPFAPTFNEMRDKTIAHAAAIKDVNPNAIVFGGVGYGWNEFRSLQDAPGRVTTPSHPGGDQGGRAALLRVAA